MDDSTTEGNPGRIPTISKVMTFIIYGLNSGTVDNVKKISCSVFTYEEIKNATDLLWTMCNLGKPPDRRGPNKVTSLVVDLVKKIEDLQNNNKLPCFVIDPLGLSQIP